MESRAAVELVASTSTQYGGIRGDRYCELTGTSSVLRASAVRKGEREPGRQLTMLSGDSVETALAEAAIAPHASLGSLRRNLVLRGISAQQLLAAQGRVVALGQEARVFVHRNCVPCMYNEKKNGRPGLMECLWDCAGVSCEVLRGGTLRTGDPVIILGE